MTATPTPPGGRTPVHGDHIIYVDERGDEHDAIVYDVWIDGQAVSLDASTLTPDGSGNDYRHRDGVAYALPPVKHSWHWPHEGATRGVTPSECVERAAAPAWQPIAAAPRDGTRLILYARSWIAPLAGRWVASSTTLRPGGDGGYWDYWTDADDPDALLDGPTHWMPIPPLPEKTS